MTSTTIFASSITPEARRFIASFYAASDDGSDHEAYVDKFTPDGTLVMGIKTSVGSDQIRTARTASWVPVNTRKHVVNGVYASDDPNDIMLFGTVEYGFKNGKSITNVWSARMLLTNSKLSFYQVFIDMSPFLEAIK